MLPSVGGIPIPVSLLFPPSPCRPHAHHAEHGGDRAHQRWQQVLLPEGVPQGVDSMQQLEQFIHSYFLPRSRWTRRPKTSPTIALANLLAARVTS